MPILALLAVMALAAFLAPSSALPSNPPESCPVTRPPDPPFVPPAPYPATPGERKYSFFFGSEKLWLRLQTDATWGLGNKTFWWREGYSAHAEPKPKLKITGRRLDAAAPPAWGRASNGFRWDWQSFMVVGIGFPALGCWEVTGEYDETDSLTFVVWVAPAGPHSH